MGPLMIDVAGLALTDVDRGRLRNPNVGGVILFSRNYVSVPQLQDLIADIRFQNDSLILAVDQEGGRVQRIRQGVTQLPALRHLGEAYDKEPERGLILAEDWGWLMAAEMLSLGFDISFAPVLDLDYGQSEIIGDRALHHDPEVVSALGTAYIRGMHEAGMAATGKHFPGHGWVVADSHVAIPVDERSEQELSLQDLLPFRRLSAQLDAVMPAHVIYQGIDPAPAGFSTHWLQQVLRRDLGFEGVIFSDDLSMEGATVAGSYLQRTKAALGAGCDMAILCNNPAGADQVLAAWGDQIIETNPQRLRGMLARQHWDRSTLEQSSRYSVVKTSMEPFYG